MRAQWAKWALAMLAMAGCVGSEDDPSQVKDLRVLAMALNPPELMLPSCDELLSGTLSNEALAVLASQVKLEALVADPAGGGRTVEYELFGCADAEDIDCSDLKLRSRLAPMEGPLLSAAPGEAGVLSAQTRPGLAQLADGSPLFSQVLNYDTFKGLGGLRVPLTLHLRAGDEEIFATKLMVYSCKFFPELTANLPPELPGILLQQTEWKADEVRQLQGEGPFEMEPVAFADRQESYVVPSLQLQPVSLVESWKIAWHATYGKFAEAETGGADFAGFEGAHRAKWEPPPPEERIERDVTFYFVVRDGRGGQSWLIRKAHYTP